MTRKQAQISRGFYGIGIEAPKTPTNLGTPWRSAAILGAAFIFTIEHRYQKQPSDTIKAWRHVPLIHYTNLQDFFAHLPEESSLVGIELTTSARLLDSFVHPERAVYLLGAEDHGLSQTALNACQSVVRLYGIYSLNVAVAGSIVLHDRLTKYKRYTTA